MDIRYSTMYTGYFVLSRGQQRRPGVGRKREGGKALYPILAWLADLHLEAKPLIFSYACWIMDPI